MGIDRARGAIGAFGTRMAFAVVLVGGTAFILGWRPMSRREDASRDTGGASEGGGDLQRASLSTDMRAGIIVGVACLALLANIVVRSG